MENAVKAEAAVTLAKDAGIDVAISTSTGMFIEGRVTQLLPIMAIVGNVPVPYRDMQIVSLQFVQAVYGGSE